MIERDTTTTTTSTEVASNPTPNKTSSSGNNNNQKSNKRSLFSVLFSKSSSSSSSSSPNRIDSQEKTDSIEEEPIKEQEEEELSSSSSFLLETNNNNIINKLEDDKIKQEQREARDDEKQEQDEENSSDNEKKKQIDDTDSYVLDLNDQVAHERFKSLYDQTINHKQRISRSVSPTTGNRWHQNYNYIPQYQRQHQQQAQQLLSVENYDNIIINNTGASDVSCSGNNNIDYRRSRSPMLEEFFERHKLQFPSIDSDQDDYSSKSDEDSDSLCLSKKRKEPNNLFINQQQTVLRRPNNNITTTTTTSDRDLRLINWRLIAARAPKQTNCLTNSNSVVVVDSNLLRDSIGGVTRTTTDNATPAENTTSDSELEDELNCNSPALFVTCSDDTSCSSVELIWTPRVRARDNNNRQRNFFYDSRQEKNFSNLISSNKNYSSNNIIHIRGNEISPTFEDSYARATSADSKRSISGGGSLIKANHHNLNSNNRVLQKLSIFELAKPIRAKGKRFGLINNDNNRKTETKNTRQKVSPEHQWVANPIFTTEDEDDEIMKPVDVNIKNKKLSDSKIKEFEKEKQQIEEQQELKEEVDVPSLLSRKSSSSSLSLSSGFDLREEEDDQLNDSSASCKSANNLRTNNDLESLKRDKKHRWSLRGRRKSIEEDKTKANNKRDNIYLNRIMNLDKKIKTNVSSIKSQLSVKFSDTSKRASVLADQLITTIKDTTKEQLSFTNNNKYRFKNGDFSSSSNQLNEFESGDKKSKQFSLIYMHQQQANGHQVITKQPLPIQTNLPPLQQPNNNIDNMASIPETTNDNIKEKVSVATMTSPIPSEEAQESIIINNTCEKQQSLPSKETHKEDLENNQSIETADLDDYKTANSHSNNSDNISINDGVDSIIKKEVVLKGNESIKAKTSEQKGIVGPLNTAQTTSPESGLAAIIKNDNNNITTNNSYNDTSLRASSLGSTRRKYRRKRRRRQVNIAQPASEDEEEEEEFYHKEYTKLRLTLNTSPEHENNDTIGRLSYSQLRSLNYWTRFRLRKLGIDWKLKPLKKSYSMDL